MKNSTTLRIAVTAVAAVVLAADKQRLFDAAEKEPQAARIDGRDRYSRARKIVARQPVHATRKAFHALGYRAVAVCEDIAHQIVDHLGVDPDIVQVLRNGIETDKFQPVPVPDNARPVIAIIGRLSGPKGELCYRLLDEVLDLDACQVRVVSGTKVPERFARFQDKVDFVGYVDDVPALLAQCDLAPPARALSEA